MAPPNTSIYYYCRKSKAIEFMVVDALAEAEPALRISEKIYDPSQFQLLDDSIIDVSLGCCK